MTERVELIDPEFWRVPLEERMARFAELREVDAVLSASFDNPMSGLTEAFSVTTSEASLGPGNVVGIEIVREHVTEWFSAVGERGVTAEKVAARAAEEAMPYLTHDVPVGPHLADQLLLPMALAGRGSFVAGPLTLHAETNIDVIRRFLDVPIRVEAIGPARFRVAIGRS